MSLKDKKIILAVTGSIAAYKTPQLVRLLVKAGAEVQVVMTEAAKDFVTPLALATVSTKEVFYAVSNGAHWNNHVHLGRWADVLLVAPCTANTLAKMAQGLCDNMVQAIYLSAACPVVFAPAMDEDMWLHPATRANVQQLQSYGHHLIPVESGPLASGLTGPGRMAEPETIAAWLEHFFAPEQQPVAIPPNTKALITAGPTYEAIDPVRFIGNFSTGKMGIALAEALAERGIPVDLVLGPSKESTQHPLITTHKVVSAREMYDACERLFPEAAISILSAAVADFRPQEAAAEKIKKGSEDTMQLTLVKNPDILAHLGAIKNAGQTVVGFALETNNELEHALKKLKAKNADMIVLNSLQEAGAGFGHDTNKVTLLSADGTQTALPLQSKKEIAKSIVDCVLALKYNNA
ncbi:bifunctional phosphopantothenoylcysteine decarboxylase/phosphopantothenate--cysteine ligase CoaBC [Taibaiella chishuiensis]|uniref:Coenzyme A biosynthesis bifunctional protein CoaBC n=1 Tax=Taibaiella chishuiensis TaxID=1434707 RepID=A0A2P8CR66_9BACT|nr:bifunctional phosphopantothenoylcysteine decarboxylase/phosphopantothenate--cysteine ligase CoaBC [Taibaiella chishuiensis]PSK87442.1 phosphopantothenoylcysteine decarboxylase/phosphopantothenate--cysteine ligase [Taibaiella chishuiensis]